MRYHISIEILIVWIQGIMTLQCVNVENRSLNECACYFDLKTHSYSRATESTIIPDQ